MLNVFFITMLSATLVLLIITRLAADRLIHHHHEQKSDFFKHYPVNPGDIVFIGDSLTDGARWDELFPGLPVKNRGINADTTSGVLARLDDIISANPRAIFILIGTNDLPWYAYKSDEAILNTYRAILHSIREELPGVPVFVQSIFPRRRSYARRISYLNTCLEEMAASCGYTFISVFPHLAAPDGQLRLDLTNDHLHLLGSGYKIWSDILRPYIESTHPGHEN